jgi:hypothetical protein
VVNGTQFTDTTCAVVHAHGGGALKVGSYYYWFGENRNADDTFKAVSVYRSTDLRTWEFRNNVLTPSSAAELNLKARHSGKCLDVVSSNTADGADIQQYACNGGANQQWSRTQS